MSGALTVPDGWRFMGADEKPSHRSGCEFIDRWTGARYARQRNPYWFGKPGWVWVEHPVEPFAAWHEGSVIGGGE